MKLANLADVPTTGRVTLPTEVGAEAEARELLVKLGADAVRNSDGTEVPEEFRDMGLKVYGKRFCNRGDNKWANSHPEELSELYLLSRPVTARSSRVEIQLLAGYFTEQVQVDVQHEPAIWWEVRDRTTGAVVPAANWSVEYESDGETPLTAVDCKVVVDGAEPFHEYTAAYLAYDIWDPVQMYNHLTNGWGDKPHEKTFDNFHPATRAHALAALKQWLEDNPKTTVVRFTTFFYQFSLIFNDQAKEKYVDWFGYAMTVSPAAIEAFEAERGYRLTPEDFVDEGYYHTYFRTPTQRWLEWMDFVQRFTADAAKEFTDTAHSLGREAMMFLGDQWAGTEPYGRYFPRIGLDAVVGSVGNGATMRMIADIPAVKYTEGRLLPYFFPDVFRESGDPAGEAIDSWIQARRAMLRNPVDRIGYGGYPSLAAKFPDFVDVAARVTQEFRTLHHFRTSAPDVLGKVAVINAWGSLRTWMPFMVAHALPYRFTEPYFGVIEALSGLPVEVQWLRFGEPIPDDVSAVIIAGTRGTSFSGGQVWDDPGLVAACREWVDAGGFLLGVGEPSFWLKGGRSFQLADVLGVDQEVGFSLSTDRYPSYARSHWVAEDLPKDWAPYDGAKGVYAIEAGAQVVRENDGYVQLAVNEYGNGRAAYAAGLPYDAVNSRLLHRLLLWGTKADSDRPAYLPDNPLIELAHFGEKNLLAAVNNSREAQTARFRDETGTEQELTLAPWAMDWFEL
ncbi:MAG: 1,3-beta-galactosyl-N-acetylhexosamine phosphorylase [Propionibacteriaceae bacterium]|jgi:1,3-beta-galactosyl-N-acetylhexosamine phosphorylase|nr:1,3-beta-galactosyl-N-acetylhexosamine phosphorylase [Propionibacteriaceae bacterium]